MPRRFLSRRTLCVLLLLALTPWLGQCSRGKDADPASLAALPDVKSRNVILMIADGAGFNAFDATSYYRHGELGKQVYDAFDVKFACTTFMHDYHDGLGEDDPAKRWSDFDWALTGFTDSAAASTALYTGQKTYDGAIAVNLDGRALTTIGELAKTQGRGVGVVTTVPFSHATPACMAAHNRSRRNYAEIAREMIGANTLDVIMGCGNPDAAPFANELEGFGRVRADYVGGRSTWERLKEGTLPSKRPWTFIQSKEDFEALADGTKTADRVIGVPMAWSTLQYYRPGDLDAAPFVEPMRSDVPDLATMARGALRVLGRNDRGFVLVIEGGAVDWASHDRAFGRMIEEMIDFNHAVEAVVRWIESNGGWEKNLLIVTADHETGALWGPDSDVEEGDPFDPIANRGKGNVPGHRYRFHDHTNALVPLFARGVGAHLFEGRIKGEDPRRGPYVDNTDVFQVMKTVLTRDVVPATQAVGAGN